MEFGAKASVAAVCALGAALGCGDGTSGWILAENAPIPVSGADSGTVLDAANVIPFEVGVPPAGRFPRNPGDFAGTCSSDLNLQKGTSDSSWRLFRDAFPDFEVFVVECATRACALLYKTPSEVPRTRRLTVVVEDFASAGWLQDYGDEATIKLSSSYMRNIAANGGSVRAEIGGVFQYLVGIDYSFHSENPEEVRWLSEGIGEWVRHQAGMGSNEEKRSGGRWTDGKSITGFFLDWLTEQYPDAVYLLNQSLDARDGVHWNERVFEHITGQPLIALWDAYQASF